MELVSYDAGVWEGFPGIVFKRVAEIQNDISNALSAFYVAQLSHQVRLGFAVDDLFDSFVIIINEDRCKLSVRAEFIASEGVLINADGGWPGIVHELSLFELQLFVKDFVNEPV